MSSMILSGDTSGAITVSAPAVAGTNTITLPAATGTVVVAGANSAITAGTAVASTSGTSIDFTGIPSWVKRITVMFNAVSSNGTGNFQVQLGTASSVEITSYTGAGGVMANGASTSAFNSTTGFAIYNGGNVYNIYGNATICLLDPSTNLWAFSFSGANGNTANVLASGGTKALSGVLTRLRVIASATGSPSDTFDGGSINILYE